MKSPSSWFSLGRLARLFGPQSKRRAARQAVQYVRPGLERLEVRELLANNVWLPERLAPLDGTTQTGVGAQLFLPATAMLLPGIGLQNTSVAVSGSWNLDDSGDYSLTLTQAGPFDGSGDRYTFSASGPVTFTLTELGTFSNSGFSSSSVVLTQTATLSWSFVETDGSGQTVQSLGGSDTFTVPDGGTAPFDPYFPAGFNWLPLLKQESSLHSLGLTSLAADSLSVGESAGSETYVFQRTGGLATVTGTVVQPLTDDLLESGQQSWSETAVEQFNSTNQGQDSFALSELGTFAGNSYALGSVSYQEAGRRPTSSTPP
jgi:hypothetical protein